jgi:hypothetical protein
MKISTIAPINATTMLPIKPGAPNPTSPNKKPPMNEPMIPITILPSRPNPPPLITTPASHPAMRPMIKYMINPSRLNLPPWRFKYTTHVRAVTNATRIISRACGLAFARLSARMRTAHRMVARQMLLPPYDHPFSLAPCLLVCRGPNRFSYLHRTFC